MTIIVNERIHLSEIVANDKAALLLHLRDREIADNSLRIPFPYTEADVDRLLTREEKATADHGRPVAWAIRQEDGGLIGACGFDGLEIGKSHKAELGYWLAKPYWGQGIMTAVVRRMCGYAFAEFRLVKIVAFVFAGNEASGRVHEKVGFELEGFHKRHFQKQGVLIDAKSYGLIKT